jgi:hypothetical protein
VTRPAMWPTRLLMGGPTIRVLSIRQPWVWAIMQGWKDVENRTWEAKYRGCLLIHASQAYDDNADREPRMRQEFIDIFVDCGVPRSKLDAKMWSQPVGQRLGVVDLVDCVFDSCRSPWSGAKMWHWVLRDPRPLPRPVRARGMTRLWRPPDRDEINPPQKCA